MTTVKSILNGCWLLNLITFSWGYLISHIPGFYQISSFFIQWDTTQNVSTTYKLMHSLTSPLQSISRLLVTFQPSVESVWGCVQLSVNPDLWFGCNKVIWLTPSHSTKWELSETCNVKNRPNDKNQFCEPWLNGILVCCNH